jgi:hypothetical protein
MPFPTGRQTPDNIPLGIFGVIWGTGLISSAILGVFVPLSVSTRQIVSLGISILAASAAIAYSVRRVSRAQPRATWGIKCLHFILLPAVYCILGFVAYMQIE